MAEQGKRIAYRTNIASNPINGNGQKWFKLWQLLEGQRKQTIVLFVVILLTAAAEGFGLSLVLPLLSGLIGLEGAAGRLYDYVSAVRGYMPEGYELEGILAALVFVFLVKSLLVVLHRGLAANYALRLREQWSNKVFSHYLYARYARTSGKKGGTLINNVAAEPLKASKAIVFLLELANKIILALTLFVILLLTDWQITLVVGSVGIGIFYLIRTQSFNYSVRLGTERLALNQGISSDATEGIGGLKEVKLYGIENRFLSRLAKKLLRYKKIETKFTVLSELPNHLVELAIISLLAGVLSYVHLTSDGELKEVVPVLGFFVLVSQRLFTYTSYVISARMKISAFVPALRMIHGLVTDVSNYEDLESGIDFRRLDSDIQFKDATFSYTKNRPVFSHLDLTIPQGKMTAIVGPSGIGKSTIADVIMRIFPLQRGKITVNGRDLRDINLASWRGKIGYVCQDAHLFNASVEENILIGNPDATKVDVVRAARVANAHDFIMKLSSGYTTLVGDRGVKLSGGQKQRVAIARAVIRDPELLIFDEATSALDDESERLIQRSIEELAQSKTILIIAHRNSTIEKADVIYKIYSDGEVRRTTYAELVCAMDQGDKAEQALN